MIHSTTLRTVVVTERVATLMIDANFFANGIQAVTNVTDLKENSRTFIDELIIELIRILCCV